MCAPRLLGARSDPLEMETLGTPDFPTQLSSDLPARRTEASLHHVPEAPLAIDDEQLAFELDLRPEPRHFVAL